MRFRLLARVAGPIAVAAAMAACDPAAAPLPEGKRVLDGLVLTFGVASNGSAVAAEIRGVHAAAGDAREQVWLARAPFTGPPESLGRGGTLPALSEDGSLIAWLESKDRGRRIGPARARRSDAAGTAGVSLAEAMPPFVFGSGDVLALTGYVGDTGRGILQRTDIATGTRRTLAIEVPPDGFARLADGSLLVITRGVAARAAAGSPHSCIAMHVMARSVETIASELACAGPRPPFLLAPDRRHALLRHTAKDGVRLGWIDVVARSIETALSAGSHAEAFDARGRAFWTEESGDRVTLFHFEGAIREDGHTPGRFSRAIVPGETGAWILLDDVSCADPTLRSPSPACSRLAAAGSIDPPPAARPVRRVVPAPLGGFPLAVFSGSATAAALDVFASPAHRLHVADEAWQAAFAPDARALAAVAITPDAKQSVLLVDLAHDRIRTLSRAAPRANIRWAGRTLFHTYDTLLPWERDDPRAGLYAVDEDAAAP